VRLDYLPKVFPELNQMKKRSPSFVIDGSILPENRRRIKASEARKKEGKMS
jgi:hypothetical protein